MQIEKKIVEEWISYLETLKSEQNGGDVTTSEEKQKTASYISSIMVVQMRELVSQDQKNKCPVCGLLLRTNAEMKRGMHLRCKSIARKVAALREERG